MESNQTKAKFWRMWPHEIFTLPRAPITLWLADQHDQANSIIFSTWQADNHRQIFRLSDSKINLEFPSGQPLVSSPEVYGLNFFFMLRHMYDIWLRVLVYIYIHLVSQSVTLKPTFCKCNFQMCFLDWKSTLTVVMTKRHGCGKIAPEISTDLVYVGIHVIRWILRTGSMWFLGLRQALNWTVMWYVESEMPRIYIYSYLFGCHIFISQTRHRALYIWVVLVSFTP